MDGCAQLSYFLPMSFYGQHQRQNLSGQSDRLRDFLGIKHPKKNSSMDRTAFNPCLLGFVWLLAKVHS